MSRARTLAGAIGSDGALNVADVAGLAAVASSGSASDLSTGTLPNARLSAGLGFGNTSVLANGTNLNTLTTRGVYAIPGAANSPNTQDWVHVEVMGNGSDQIQQRLRVAVYISGAEYLRESTNGGTTWSSWVQIAGNYKPANLAGDTFTGQLKTTSVVVSDSANPVAAQMSRMYYPSIYTYEVSSGVYANRMIKLGTMGSSGDGQLVCEIHRNGDFNYAGHEVMDFEIHQWSQSTGTFSAQYKLRNGSITGNFATDSSRNVYYWDAAWWTQRMQVIVHYNENFTVSMADQNYNSGLTWRSVSTTNNTARTSWGS